MTDRPAPSLTARVFQNTLTVLTGQALYLIAGFAWSIKLGRYLTPEGFGLYSSIYAYVAFFELLTNSGIDTVVVRRISQEAPDSRTARDWLWHGLILKLMLAVTACALALAGLLLLPAEKMPIAPYAWIACFGIFFPCLTYLTVVFQSRLRMAVPIACKLVTGVLFLSALFWLAAHQASLRDFVVAKLFCFAVWPVLLLVFGFRHLKGSGPIRVGLLRDVFGQSLPFFLSSIFILIYYRLDVLMIGWMSGQEQVGYYAAAFRLTDSLSILPGALMTSLFPVFSKQAKDDREKLKRGYRYSLKYLCIIILPIACGTTLLAGPLMRFFFKEAYLPSARALAILSWAAVFNFIGYVLGYLLMALHRQAVNAWTNVGQIGVNVVLNLLLIPSMGFSGAAVATVATEAFAVVVWFYFVTKTLKFVPQGWFLKPALASLAMSGVILGLKSMGGSEEGRAGFLAVVVLAIAVYLLAVWLLGGLDAEDRGNLRKILFRRVT